MAEQLVETFRLFEVSLVKGPPFPMPGNTVKVTLNGSTALEWYVGDSKIEPLLDYLNKQGFPIGRGVALKDFKRIMKHKPSINELLTHPFEEVRTLANYLHEAICEELNESEDSRVSDSR